MAFLTLVISTYITVVRLSRSAHSVIDTCVPRVGKVTVTTCATTSRTRVVTGRVRPLMGPIITETYVTRRRSTCPLVICSLGVERRKTHLSRVTVTSGESRVKVCRLRHQTRVAIGTTVTRTETVIVLLTRNIRNHSVQTRRRVHIRVGEVTVTISTVRRRESNIPVRTASGVTTKTVAREASTGISATGPGVSHTRLDGSFIPRRNRTVNKARLAVDMSRGRRVRGAVTIRTVLVAVEVVAVARRQRSEVGAVVGAVNQRTAGIVVVTRIAGQITRRIPGN